MKLTTMNATITGFSYSDKGLTVYFSAGDRKLRTLAHPALQVSPHIGKEQELQVIETEQGWKMIKPYPSKDEIDSWKKAKAQKEAIQASTKEATKAQVALLTF